MNRQLFLTEQGYAYKIIKRGDWDILSRTPEELAARKKPSASAACCAPRATAVPRTSTAS